MPNFHDNLRTVRSASVALSILLTGCASPVGSTAKKNAAVAAKTKNKKAAVSNSLVADASKSAPVERMTVQGESVAAGEVWLGHRDELAEKAKSFAPEEFRGFVTQRSAELITDKIGEMLLYQKASLRQTPELDKKVDAYVDGEIRKIVTAEYDGLQRRFEKYLESQGTTLEAARSQLRRQFIIAGYLETEIRPKVAEPTRADLLEAFESNKDAWSKPPRWSMSLIDIRTADLLPTDVTGPSREQLQSAREEAKSKARAALAELRDGADFAGVARQHSHGARAAEGGNWGWVTRESVRERFLPAVEALQKLRGGQVSDILETPDGFFIVRCDAHEPAVEPDFQSVQPQLKERVSRRRYNQLINERIVELRSKARVEPANLDRFHAAVVAAGLGFPGSPR